MKVHVSPHLLYEDFLLYWHWLAGTQGDDTFAKRVEMEKIKRVFRTLEMFTDQNEMCSFIKSWGCQLPDTATFEELQSGMAMLTPSQYEKFERLMRKIKEKNEADQEKQRRQYVEIEKQLKKEEQKEKILASRSNIPSSGKTALMQRPHENHATDKLKADASFKGKQQKEGLLRKVSRLIRGLSSGSSLGSAKVSDDASISRTTSHIDSPDKENTYVNIAKLESGDSEEGFTYRLTTANVALMREECNMTHHAVHEISAIEESLISFGVSSYDQVD